MSIQEVISKTYSELVSLSQTSADAFAAERNRRFRRLLEHHIHNGRNTAYADLWRSHGLDPLGDVPTDLADVERPLWLIGNSCGKPTMLLTLPFPMSGLLTA